jgi:hypothetical protein
MIVLSSEAVGLLRQLAEMKRGVGGKVTKV